MKIKSLILSVLLSIVVMSCFYNKYKQTVVNKRQVEVDDRVKIYYESVILDCGEDSTVIKDFLDQNLKAIVVSELNSSIERFYPNDKRLFDGYYSDFMKKIFIDEGTVVDSMRTKIVLYHEIGHVFGLRHSCFYCPNIMSVYTETYCIYEDKSVYKEEVKILIDSIKVKLN